MSTPLFVVFRKGRGATLVAEFYNPTELCQCGIRNENCHCWARKLISYETERSLNVCSNHTYKNPQIGEDPSQRPQIAGFLQIPESNHCAVWMDDGTCYDDYDGTPLPQRPMAAFEPTDELKVNRVYAEFKKLLGTIEQLKTELGEVLSKYKKLTNRLARFQHEPEFILHQNAIQEIEKRPVQDAETKKELEAHRKSLADWVKHNNREQMITEIKKLDDQRVDFSQRYTSAKESMKSETMGRDYFYQIYQAYLNAKTHEALAKYSEMLDEFNEFVLPEDREKVYRDHHDRIIAKREAIEFQSASHIFERMRSRAAPTCVLGSDGKLRQLTPQERSQSGLGILTGVRPAIRTPVAGMRVSTPSTPVRPAPAPSTPIRPTPSVPVPSAPARPPRQFAGAISGVSSAALRPTPLPPKPEEELW